MDSTSNNLDTPTTNEMSSHSNKPLLWDDAKDIALPRCFLPLSPTSHKGSSGRIGVLGGSARYTGAPYYAAMAALQAGADLAYVFCADEAALPIKCYSPELMVVPVYPGNEFDRIVTQEQQNGEENQTNEERSEFLIQRMVQEVVSMMDRMHVLVIGPGLGRCPLVFQATAQIIEEAKRRQVALIVDADALFLLTLPKYQKLLQGYSKAVLTPNKVEYQRLKAAYNDDETFQQAFDQNILVIKGRHDQVVRVGGNNNSRDENGASSSSLICAEEGGLKRSGGIGDVLAGTLGTCIAWHEIIQKQTDSEASSSASTDWRLWSCWTACCITKGATKRAFGVKKRAMTAPDILKEIGETVEHLTATSTPSR